MTPRHKAKRCSGPYNDFFFEWFDAGTEKSQQRKALDRATTTITIFVLTLAALRIITGVM